jgi:hypothetical protein
LLAGTVLLVALGLGADLALSCMLGSFLSDRVDRQFDRVTARHKAEDGLRRFIADGPL